MTIGLKRDLLTKRQGWFVKETKKSKIINVTFLRLIIEVMVLKSFVLVKLKII